MGPNDRFFQVVENHLLANLPVGIRPFHHPQYFDNYLRIRYPNLPYSMYEMHFAKRSKHHAKHFGTGHLDLIAFYFGEGVNLSTRLAWLEALEPMEETISKQIGMPIVVGEWGDNWAWIAVCLQISSSNRNAQRYTNIFAKFIEATYGPIQQAFAGIGYY